MIVKKSGHLEVDNLTEREVKWILKYLHMKNIPLAEKLNPTFHDKKVAIVESINAHFFSENLLPEDNIQPIINLCKNSLLPIKDFNWISKNHPRLFRWVTCYLAKHKNMNIVITFDSKNDFDYKTGFDAIIDFFDSKPARSPDPFLQAEGHATLMEELISEWDKLADDGLDINWLREKNPSQCKWAWDYLLNKKRAYLKFNSMSARNRYEHVITSIDLMPPSESKELLLLRMNKAWNQKNQRDQLEGKKSCNFILDLEVKRRLDEIAKHDKSKLNATIERLINDEYKRIDSQLIASIIEKQ